MNITFSQQSEEREGLGSGDETSGETQQVVYTRGAQNTVCKLLSCSTVEVGKMYCSARWLLKTLSTNQVIVLVD